MPRVGFVRERRGVWGRLAVALALGVLVTAPLEKLAWSMGSFYLKPSMVLAALAVALTVFDALAGGRRIGRSLVLAAGLFLALSSVHLLSALNAVLLFGSEGLGRALSWAALYVTLYFVFFAVALGTQSPQTHRRAIRWWAVLGPILALYGLAQALLAPRGIDLDALVMGLFRAESPRTGLESLGALAVRITGPMGDPNNFGAYLTSVWPVLAAMALIVFRRNRRRGLALGLGAVLCLVAVALTLSRSAVMGTLAAAMVMVWFLRGRRSGQRLVVVGATGLLVLAMVLAVVAGSTVLDVIRLRVVDPPTQEVSDRTMLYSAAVSLYGSAPFTGTGLGTYEFALRDVFGRLWENANPHSAYLSWLSDTGLPGFTINVVILLLLLRRVVVARRCCRSDRDSVELTVALLAACAGWLVTNIFYQTYTYQYSWVLYALLYNAPQLAGETRPVTAARLRLQRVHRVADAPPVAQ